MFYALCIVLIIILLLMSVSIAMSHANSALVPSGATG
jgi:hypothetical protein